MIIDCHGHYTTTPPGVGAYREAQKEAVANDPSFKGEKGSIDITDDEIRVSIEKNQLKLQRSEDRPDHLSPRAAGWGITLVMNGPVFIGHNIRTTSNASVLVSTEFCASRTASSVARCHAGEVGSRIRRTVEELGFLGIN